ncbi:hypothetical protein H5410_054187 [Solanum commersonii]|uniref:NAC domain-containing protein n=1 Tax=Solanum commersonii TaxID=4109 RepID=A0A9J5X9H8_SOLCO|nr:hypothetical protein H5410_054187 [Solanum commersonii]
MEAGTKYFFTQLKKLEPNHKRFIRTLVGGGSWKGQDKGKPVGAKKFGIKKTYSYEENKKDGKDKVSDVSWIMKEYSLDDKVIKSLRSRSTMKHEDVVLCYIRRKVKDKELGRGNDDDDTQPQGPNESGYGDQLTQQLLIVTCPMVEGNINGELVVPEQLSTYQEEQVQNVEETAGSASSDYHVDPTFTGVLNNDECLLIDELGDFDDFMGENQEWLSELLRGYNFDFHIRASKEVIWEGLKPETVLDIFRIRSQVSTHTDDQLIRYLIKFVASNSYVCNDIQFEDLYGSKKSWELLEDSSDTKYFFTQLKKLKLDHTRFIRTLVGGGSWKGKAKGKPDGEDEVNDVSWIMKEYSLDDKVIKLLRNRGIMKHEDVVLCYIRCKVKESGNHMPTTTASENVDDTQPQGPICTSESVNHMPTTTARGNDDDDDIQTQGPNESGYGDQLPQQMVKPMQIIESGYVGCDDEKMNDMTTQPQWPNYNSIQSLLLGDYNDPSTLTNEMMNITATQYTSVDDFLNSGQSFSSLLGLSNLYAVDTRKYTLF